MRKLYVLVLAILIIGTGCSKQQGIFENSRDLSLFDVAKSANLSDEDYVLIDRRFKQFQLSCYGPMQTIADTGGIADYQNDFYLRSSLLQQVAFQDEMLTQSLFDTSYQGASGTDYSDVHIITRENLEILYEEIVDTQLHVEVLKKEFKEANDGLSQPLAILDYIEELDAYTLMLGFGSGCSVVFDEDYHVLNYENTYIIETTYQNIDTADTYGRVQIVLNRQENGNFAIIWAFFVSN